MCPIPLDKLHQQFITLDTMVTVLKAGQELLRAGGLKYQQWYIVVELGPGDFKYLTMAELLKSVEQKGPSILKNLLVDVPNLLMACKSIDIQSMGLGAAQQELIKSYSKCLVVLDQGEPIGLVTETDKSGFTVLTETLFYFKNYDIAYALDGAHPPPVEKTARFLNTCLVDAANHQLIEQNYSLALNTSYLLRVDIGPLSKQSVIVNPFDFPDDKLPPSPTGWWLEAIAASDDFVVETKRHPFFLPVHGPAWVCACEPGGPHTCVSHDPFMFIPLVTPQETGLKTLRLTIYFRKNAVQSLLLTAEVAQNEAACAGYSAKIDFTLTARLDNLDSLPKRIASIVINQNLNGTHRLVFNGHSEDPHHLSLSDNTMQNTTKDLRAVLDKIHYSKSGLIGIQNNYDNNNYAKSKDKFIEDLKILAGLGWGLFDMITNKVNFEVDDPGTIQIARAATEFVFPWAFIYDIPKESGVDWQPCQLLKDWDGHATLVPTSAKSCPHENAHGENTLCPFGFWGYRHIIELPPSLDIQNIDTIKQVIHVPGQLNFLFIQNKNLKAEITEDHVNSLKQKVGNAWTPVVSKADTKTALDSQEPEIVYFYVHGKKMDENLFAKSSLLVGDDEEIQTGDIKAWFISSWKKKPEHWRNSSPLIFINGCHTLDLLPDSPVSFVDEFCRAAAAGVIGTEITISQRVASEMAETFFENFVNNIPAGEALRLARMDLLNKGNVLGLVYTAYCAAELVLE